MKQTSLFTGIFALALSVTMSLGSVAQANPPPTKCYIYVQSAGPCRNPAPVNQWFLDNYEGSAANNGRCLLRAREYHQYCNRFDGTPMNVFAAFNVVIPEKNTEITINGQIVGGPNQLTTFGLNWQPLPTK